MTFEQRPEECKGTWTSSGNSLQAEGTITMEALGQEECVWSGRELVRE